MSTTTARLSLVKPDLVDNADITVINSDLDIIDSAIAGQTLANTFTAQNTFNGGIVAGSNANNNVPRCMNGLSNLPAQSNVAFQSGQITGIAFAAQNSKTGVITFPIPFTSGTPIVLFTVQSNSNFDLLVTTNGAATNTSVTWRMATNTAGNITGTVQLNWIAFGVL